MTWTKIGDEFGDQCWQLSDAAYRLHTEGLIWSNRKHLDGRLDKNEMLRWAKHPGTGDELVAVGFWEDRGEHFQIVHHQGVQRTSAEWLHQSAVNAANRRKGKARPVRPTDKSSNDSSDERDWSVLDRTGLDKPGTSLSGRAQNAEAGKVDPGGNDYYPEPRYCWGCGDGTPVGAEGREGDDTTLCRGCNDDRMADAGEWIESEP